MNMQSSSVPLLPIKLAAGLLIILFVGLWTSLPVSAVSEEEPTFLFEQHAPISVGAADATDDTGARSWSGAYTTNIPIVTPPGRSGLQPNLSLQYNSQQRDRMSQTGMGWNLALPSIMRIHKTGIENLYTEHLFSSSMDGELVPVEIINEETGHGTYRARSTTGNYIEYEFTSDDEWILTEKSGLRHFLGSDASSRQDDPDDATRIYKWMVDRTEDANTNRIDYSYTKYEGNIYPETIYYTGHGEEVGPLRIEFGLEAEDGRPLSYAAGFGYTTYYRIHEIALFAQEDLDWSTKYVLEYTTASNERDALLESVQRIGQTADGTESAEEPTVLSYSQDTAGWTHNDSYRQLSFVSDRYGYTTDDGARLADFNGDGLPDVIRAIASSDESEFTWSIELNNGNGWWDDYEEEFSHPDIAFIIQDNYEDEGLRLADMNGDGYVDLVYGGHSFEDMRGVYLNNGDGTGWPEEPTGYIPASFTDDAYGISRDTGLRMVEVNGDGLPDLISSNSGIYGDYEGGGQVWLNKGGYFNHESDEGWYVPVGMVIQNAPVNMDNAVRFGDFNGDGLTDIWRDHPNGDEDGLDDLESDGVFLNTGDGTGWELDPDFDSNYWFPISMTGTARGDSTARDEGTRQIDINNDGITDLVHAREYDESFGADPVASIWINRGTTRGWVLEEDYADSIGVGFWDEGNAGDIGARFADLNGDGLVDIARGLFNSLECMCLKNGEQPDLLTGITLPTGGNISVSYDHTPELEIDGEIANPSLSAPRLVVTNVTRDDAMGNAYTTSYAYANGSYFYESNAEREFAGFEYIDTIHPDGAVTRQYFHQGNDSATEHGEFEDSRWKIGLSYRTEIRDEEGHAHQVDMSRWDEVDLGDGATAVFLHHTTTQVFNDTEDHRDTATEYTYDHTTGNLLETISWGEVLAADDGTFEDLEESNDQRIVTTTYATDASGRIRSAASSTTLSNADGVIEQETKYLYDGLPFGEVSTGNNTSTEEWIEDDRYRITTRTFTVEGHVETTTDARGNTTTTTYDAYGIYPETVTNALEHTTTTTYDYSTGKMRTQTDANGFQTINEYDGLGRILSTERPHPTDPALTELVATYAYVTESTPQEVIATNHIDGSVTTESYTYTDGLGHNRQVRVEAEGVDQFTVMDTTYDERGRVAMKSLPYHQENHIFSEPTDTVALQTTYTYSPLHQVLTQETILGTATLEMDQWNATVTDAEGNSMDYAYTAYGDLETVTEYNADLPGVTAYTYNARSQLIRHQDPELNERDLTYNGLGQLAAIELLHEPDAPSVVSWTHAYDDAGNKATTTNPKDQVIAYTYDELNRLDTETHNDGVTSYSYDSCDNGIGRLCIADVNGKTITRYAYDGRGNVNSEEKRILGRNLATSFEHNRAGQLTLVTYPEGSTTEYLINDAGQLEHVLFDDALSLEGPVDIIDTIDYAPHGMESYQLFGNGVEVINNYNPDALYQLETKEVLSHTGTREHAAYVYEYDTVGNITGIAHTSDYVDNSTATYIYDDLYRLTSSETILNPGEVDEMIDTRSWTYDTLGNIDTSSELGDYQYLAGHPHAANRIGSKRLQYDANGNIKRLDDMLLYWNDSNRLVGAQTADGTTGNLYDHTGQRSYQATSGVSSKWRFANDYYEEYGNTWYRHIIDWRGNQLATSRFKFSDSSLELWFHHTDHLGGSATETDEDALIAQFQDYHPFGSERRNEQFLDYDNHHRFNGNILDATGLYYYNARYYQPEIGRFASIDPAFGNIYNPQSMNAYSYVMNNPLNYIDPTGAISEKAHNTMKSMTAATGQFALGTVYAGSAAAKIALIGAAAKVSGGLALVAAPVMITGAVNDFDTASTYYQNSFINVSNTFQGEAPETPYNESFYGYATDDSPTMNTINQTSQMISDAAIVSFDDAPKAVAGIRNAQTQYQKGKAIGSAGAMITDGAITVATGSEIREHAFNATVDSYANTSTASNQMNELDVGISLGTQHQQQSIAGDASWFQNAVDYKNDNAK